MLLKREKYLADLLNALEGHVCQHVGFNAAKEDIVIHLIHYLLILDKIKHLGFSIERRGQLCARTSKLKLQ